MNQVFISGRLTKDPELQQSKGGKAYARVSVAVDRGYSKDEKKRREDAGEQTTDFVQVVLFGQTAEYLVRNGARGARVIIAGRMEINALKSMSSSSRTGGCIAKTQTAFIFLGKLARERRT